MVVVGYSVVARYSAVYFWLHAKNGRLLLPSVLASAGLERVCNKKQITTTLNFARCYS